LLESGAKIIRFWRPKQRILIFLEITSIYGKIAYICILFLIILNKD